MNTLRAIVCFPVAVAVACWFLACALVEVVILGRRPNIETEGDE